MPADLPVLRHPCTCTATVFPCVACLAYDGRRKVRPGGRVLAREAARAPKADKDAEASARILAVLATRALRTEELCCVLGLTRIDADRVLQRLRQCGRLQSVHRGQQRAWALVED